MFLTRCNPYGFFPLVESRPQFLGQFVAAFLLLMSLTACATPNANRSVSTSPLPSSVLTDQMIDQLYRQSASPGLTCVPYARNRTGVSLRGDAYTWWDGADGNYQRGHRPQPGAILVLSQTRRLQSGHVAVVAQVVGAREILVDHANWVAGETITGMPVIDVSEKNDWTMLRFWYAPARTFGSPYPAEGFIYPAAVPRDNSPAIGSDPIAELIRDQQ